MKFVYTSFSEIISTAERTDIAPHVKDGYIMMFIYMPVVFTSEFTPYIGQIINPILKVNSFLFLMSITFTVASDTVKPCSFEVFCAGNNSFVLSIFHCDCTSCAGKTNV